MLNPNTFIFLKWLSEFNDRRFFNLNKELYKEIQKDFIKFGTDLIQKISKFDENIEWTESKKCIFRINRDTRFSKDKTPYKTNLWIFIAPGWKKSIFPGYYVHIQPDQSFFWGWIFMPTTENAYKIRTYIYNNFDEFESILKNKEFKKYFGNVYSFQPSLKKTPKWYEENHPSIKYLKFKDWLAKDISLKENEILSENFEEQILKYAKSLYLLNNFLYKALI